ncbi:spore germination protein [Desulfosporosinus sp. BICA1-9]|uniref:spore germination protein n=1 Tax=Desulfosporosinus sp. BICA1-9 TaxID=1531958 RepID=UPI00054C45EB|nr:spore germination protein [Desulfosporosinus sp. BICA1-9]KJS46538.1 MAG: spore gernimation protein GerA [Peptococcaceae bacterium BRH_c23]KJS89893.1 MAG: spore gernimation protein GerA [Desulfosporosinus sp. BICA1-9]HBW35844.1 spore germination protein [Desulfosporosinus sp.]
MRHLRTRKRKKIPEPELSQSVESDNQQESLPLCSSLAENLDILQTMFAKCTDFAYRELKIGQEHVPALLLYVNGITDEQTVNQDILKSLVNIQCSNFEASGSHNIEMIKNLFMEVGNIKEISTIGEISDAILTGSVALLLEGTASALMIETKGLEGRPISESVTEGVVRGPREGFTESLRKNTALVRRKIKTPSLKLEKFVLGQTTKTEVNIAYLEGTANPKVVAEVKKRISLIKVDSVLESAYIEEMIEDEPFTLFPQIDHSERPDKIAAGILQGQVAIFTDGTPFVLIVPTMMFQFLQSSEDYYDRSIYATSVRLVRFLFLNLALLLPALYIAITTFHRELLPTPLLISITGAREGVPFPTVVEVLMMEVIFEALREAGLRLPKQVGQAVSIVGGLVIGEAAVSAGMISPATVIVVALTGISSFCIPSYSFALAIRISRFGMIVLSAILGLFGMLLGLLVMQAHLVSLRSFGVPYFAPLAPFNLKDMKDFVMRSPWWAMIERPRLIANNDNRQRQKFFRKPSPPDEDEQ